MAPLIDSNQATAHSSPLLQRPMDEDARRTLNMIGGRGGGRPSHGALRVHLVPHR
jgi:hypothetical protein